MTASNFNTALTATLVYEGGWSDHPQDPGGPTMKGITLERYRAWKGNRAITEEQLREIGDDEVRSIYRTGYWDAVKGDKLPSGVDFQMFDWAVNSGPSRAIKALQRIVGVTPDGQMGMMTLAAVNKFPPEELIAALTTARTRFVQSLSTYASFGRGWSVRIAAVHKKAKALAGGLAVSSPDTSSLPTSHKARVSDTKATAKPGVKPAAVATMAAVGTAATTAAQQLQDLSETLTWLKWAVVALTVVACAAGLYVALKGNDDA